MPDATSDGVSTDELPVSSTPPQADTPPHRVLTDGLAFPEGPVVKPDGSILLVEIRAERITRVAPDGTTTVVAEVPGGPNGLAIGADGAGYICNNGGFLWTDFNGLPMPLDLETGVSEPPNFLGGSLQRLDLDTGELTTLYTECNGVPLQGPNDLVVDADGGIWFTSLGKTRLHDLDKGGVYYAEPDGSHIVAIPGASGGPNGIGLSPDGTRLYAAETHTGRVLEWQITGPGTVAGHPEVIAATTGPLDSLAIEADGTVVVAALPYGMLLIDPKSRTHSYVAMPGFMCTNICFGGPDHKTAWVTLSALGHLLEVEWPRPGLKLNF